MTAAVTFAAGCSNNSEGGGSKEPNAGVAANKICDGTLDTSAAAALQRLSGTKQFDELTGTNEAGESNTFSVDRAIKHLHDSYSQRGTCWVYKTGDDSGRPLLEVRFSATRSHPSSSEEEESSTDTVEYPVGVFARTSRYGADLFFRCPTKATTDDAHVGDTDYVKAEMYSATGKMTGGSVSKDRMTVLNSMARAVADAGGCASAAALPMQIPAGKAH
ncbi:hypothetical protein [Streptomyces sp. WM6386]|uniref:hypothetical protein n=1 Tax=Streptomyces sp. WM6386 TaxID=1415558 RepID=UPI00131CA0C0|nr:hypothetical protein [Streptomyces sp. WM6386]